MKKTVILMILLFMCQTCFILSAQDNIPKINGLLYNPDGIELLYVEGNGKINGFFIGRFEITQAQWRAVMGNNKEPKSQKEKLSPEHISGMGIINTRKDINPKVFKGDSLPALNISWNDAQEFIRRLNQKTGRNYRLPTKAEWEYAAKSGTNNDSYKYAGDNSIKGVAWCIYFNSGGYHPHSVGTKRANSLGIYDMCGNVKEWCEDIKGSSRILKGGCWFDNEKSCRISFTEKSSPSDSDNGYGFRVVIPY